MKRLFYLLSALFLLSCSVEPEHFTIDVLNGYTPVKSQGSTNLCWAYAMLAAIETEHIMQGDSVHLSVAWVERMMAEDSTVRSQRGMGQTLLNMIGRYGLVPYDAMKRADDIPPRFAFMLGATYTPQEFAHSVCAPGEYIGLGTTDDEPYNAFFTPDLPDNWEHNQLYNVPADSLLSITERAVRQHHGVCWEGDTSEPGFDWKRGVARESLISGSTTDDHCMAIVGLARDAEGEPFFIMKNSWGTKNPYDGLLFLSYGYFLRKTVAVYLPTCLVSR